jgi:hypothetical protein
MATIVSCYLPQLAETHTYACEALARLPTSLPHHLLIVGGDLQGGWDGTSPKYIHIASLPYVRWARSSIPTFTPRRQQEQAMSIDHLTIWDPEHLSRQVEETQTVPSAFPDRNGVLGRIHLPILTAEAIVPPLAKPPREHMFQYPIPEYILEE